MSFHLEQQLKQGADPRGFADFAALKTELDKLHHPARPDVDWPYAEQLCLSLFRQNGVELQGAVWFCLIRAQQAGLQGVAESLPLVHALVVRQWSTFWPQQLPARLQLLTQLGQQLVQCLRGCRWTQEDLRALYETGQLLQEICSQLVRRELDLPEPLEHLRSFIDSAARRITGQEQSADRQPAPHMHLARPEAPPDQALVYVVTTRKGDPWHKKSVLGGVLLGAGLAVAAVWGAHWHENNTLQSQLAPLFAPLPGLVADTGLSDRQLDNEREWIVHNTGLQLATLGQLSPGWQLEYGQHLLQQVEHWLPGDPAVAGLQQYWQRQLQRYAMPDAGLGAWRRGMDRLEGLSARLNALDEQRGQYMTISQLKTEVFGIREAFLEGIPLEERLYRLGEHADNESVTPVMWQQADDHLKQLSSRQALIRRP